MAVDETHTRWSKWPTPWVKWPTPWVALGLIVVLVVVVAVAIAIALAVSSSEENQPNNEMLVPAGTAALTCATIPWASPNRAVGEVNEALPRAAVVQSVVISRDDAGRVVSDIVFTGNIPAPPVTRENSSFGTFTTGAGLFLFLQLSEGGPAASITQGDTSSEWFVKDAISTVGENIRLAPTGTQVSQRQGNQIRVTLDLEDFDTEGFDQFEPFVNVAVYEYTPPSRSATTAAAKYYPEQSCQ